MYNLLFNIKILFLLIPDATVTGLSAMIYTLPEYQRVWAMAPSLVQTEEHRAGQCHTLTQDLQPPSAQLPAGGLSIWGYRGMRSWRTLLPWCQSSHGLLRGRGRVNRRSWTTASPWAPQSFNTNCGKGHRTIQFGGKMPRCATCSFLLLHRGFPKYYEAPGWAHGTLLPLSSSCSSWCQAAIKN